MVSTNQHAGKQKKQVRHFLSIDDLSVEELKSVLALAGELKKSAPSLLKGKSFAMIFQKHSTRTRVSFEAGVARLGGNTIYLRADDLQLSRGEPISDTAKVLSRYVEGIFVRLFSHKDAIELAKHASVPVINGLTDYEHPCQVLADMLTVMEHKGALKGLTLAYLGDAENNVTHSLMLACSKLGINMRVACPRGYTPSDEVVKKALEHARESGASLLVTQDPLEAVKGADVVYTDTWVSMGDEADKVKRLQDLAQYQVTAKLMNSAKKDAIFMHDLPAYRGHEVAAEVIDGPQSVIYDQAENRLWTQNAVLLFLLKL